MTIQLQGFREPLLSGYSSVKEDFANPMYLSVSAAETAEKTSLYCFDEGIYILNTLPKDDIFEPNEVIPPVSKLSEMIVVSGREVLLIQSTLVPEPSVEALDTLLESEESPIRPSCYSTKKRQILAVASLVVSAMIPLAIVFAAK